MTEQQLNKLNIVFGLLLLACIPWIWFTASTVSIVVFTIALVGLILNVTGVIGSLFGRKNG